MARMVVCLPVSVYVTSRSFTETSGRIELCFGRMEAFFPHDGPSYTVLTENSRINHNFLRVLRMQLDRASPIGGIGLLVIHVLHRATVFLDKAVRRPNAELH